jgi:protein TonB
MSYVDQGMTRGRVYAIIGVAILHALLAYAVVTGLAYNFMKKAAEDLKTFDVQEEPPPPPEPPPPEQPQVQPPPIVTPPPLVQTNVPPPPITTVTNAPPPQITVEPPRQPTTHTCSDGSVLPTTQGCPQPPRTVEPAHARANLASYVSDADYPASAIRAEQQGTTGFRLTVGTDGRVTGCDVTSSSGSPALDQATCRIMRSRARFTPARDDHGNPTTDSVSSRIRWVLPAD